jgi:hypothetical protein
MVDATVQVFNTAGGTPAGSIINAVSPYKGYLIEAGFAANDSVTSAMTLAVSIGNNIINSAASNYTQVVASTSFSSTNIYQGNTCSVTLSPSSANYVNAGDAIRFVTSGGNTSAVGCTLYAVIRRAV